MLAPEYLHAGAYVAIAVGTFFEGEMIMLAAGVAAGTGLLSLPLIITAGMAGIFASDTLCFLIGRFAGRWLARWFPRAHARLDARDLLATERRHHGEHRRLGQSHVGFPFSIWQALGVTTS